MKGSHRFVFWLACRIPCVRSIYAATAPKCSNSTQQPAFSEDGISLRVLRAQVTVPNLQEGSTYYYKVGDPTKPKGVSPVFHFKVLDPAQISFLASTLKAGSLAYHALTCLLTQ